MSRPRVSVPLLSIGIAAVAITGTASAVTSPHSHAAQAKTSAKVGPVYAGHIVDRSVGVKTQVPSNGPTPDLMPLRVPAGSYLVTLTGVFNHGTETSAGVGCSLAFRGAKTSTFGHGLAVSLSSDEPFQTASEQEAVHFTARTKIAAYCFTEDGNSGGTAGINTASLTALAVAVVHKS